MLGSDPIAALLGANTDFRCSQTVLKTYLRQLIEAGASVTMLGPDVVVPEDASDEVKVALATLIETYPTGSQMPEEKTGVLANLGVVDADRTRVNNRVATYFRHIYRVVGKDLAPELMAAGVIKMGAAIHVGSSGMVAVVVPDADSLEQWRGWSAEVSGDRHERHTAPTILLPNTPGGGVYLFRTESETRVPVGVTIPGDFTIETGDMVVPIPPTHQGGAPVKRLGPARMLPAWLRDVVVAQSGSDATAPVAMSV